MYVQYYFNQEMRGEIGRCQKYDFFAECLAIQKIWSGNLALIICMCFIFILLDRKPTPANW